MLVPIHVQRQLTDDSAVAYRALIQSHPPMGRVSRSLCWSVSLPFSLTNHLIPISLSLHFTPSHLSIVIVGPMLSNKLSLSMLFLTGAHNQIRCAPSSRRRDQYRHHRQRPLTDIYFLNNLWFRQREW